ncbi:S9 family peptidase [Eudoraea chungangensis]|uniref:S9 family peptidase n=1 Tax=Eudoraea chungangensis TaxID=1481905 RepID=UPI0023EDB74A|nr:DPP IV N-terminal domain-containing protein [Eudoraea chungangensis]
MNYRTKHLIIAVLLIGFRTLNAQVSTNPELLTVDQLFSDEFKQERERKIQWIKNGEAYVTIEKSSARPNADELVKYNSATQKKSYLVPADALITEGKSLSVESFSLSPDESKVLIFTNTSRVWRLNTKGDYWVYDLSTKTLKQLGAALKTSSLMFAKFSFNNRFVYYVYNFNIYKEDYQTGETTQLTFDGTGDIINGTFDWAYEEEFGKRDGFTISPKDHHLAFWQIDATDIGTFYMINNTDSIYSKPLPLQYPKVGQDPSAAKIGLINLVDKKISWIPLPGGEKENYIPGIQWVTDDLLLIQQMNRHQNKLIVWSYAPSKDLLSKVYEEKEDTWVDLLYPDISAGNWENNDLPLIDKNTKFLRMTENDEWRHIYSVSVSSGTKKLVTPFNYDVAAMRNTTEKDVYFIASPNNSTQRYLFLTDLKGNGKAKRLTPDSFKGINNYDISPNGKYAIHAHQSTTEVRTVRFISLPNHKTIKVLVDNQAYKQKLYSLELPEVKFSKVKTEEGIEMDVRSVLPTNFDPSKKYPVIFHVYGEPWGQEAIDSQIGHWNIMMAQKGYVIIDMDNRGTPCLKGSAWRKSIYRKIGIINTRDQALAAKELLKLDYLDENRTAVWGHSGGGSMTLNLLFQYPETYKTGVAMAAVSNQLIYDNIYQERYMGLPQENKEDFIKGSPVTYAKNLEGNLLIIHGTADDNVHYQSAELLINELIKQNKQFQFMAYPNRSHGIREGENTSRHLYTLLTNYIMENTPPD